MKIRNGFVSNSSSSSFAILGRLIPMSELKKLTLKDIKSMDLRVTTDAEGGEGEVICTIKDEKFLAHLLKNNHIREAFEVYAECWETTKQFDVNVLPKKGKITFFVTNADQSNVSSIEEWKDYYGQDDEGGDEIPKGYVRLEMTDDGHNKFYEMSDGKDGKMYVTYGKIGSDGVTIVYAIDEWEAKYTEKINKGYVLVDEE